MKKLGYSTFHAGKWHLGVSQKRFLPGAKGFDEYRLLHSQPIGGALPVVTEKGKFTTDDQVWRPAYEADEIIGFIERQSQKGKPAFVDWWPIEPHWPLYVPPGFDNDCCGFDLETYRGQLLAMMYQWDREFGRIVAYLKKADLYEDSLIIITSDNGGLPKAVAEHRKLAVGKSSIYEGGIRVPFVARWPAVIARGETDAQVMTSMDIFPTLMDLLGGGKPATDGEDMSAIFEGGEAEHRKPPFWQVRTDSVRRYDDETRSEQFAMRQGCLKVIKTEAASNPYRMYDVCADPAEEMDLAPKRPYRFERMKRDLLERRMEISRYTGRDLVDEPVIIENDDRLNIHQDDITIKATVEPGYEREGRYVLYRRGTGIRLTLEEGRLVARIKGVADASNRPAIKEVSLEAPLPRDNKRHDIQLMIRGYLRGQSTIWLFVDGRERDKLWGGIGSYDLGESVFAVLWEEVPAQLGDEGISLADYEIFLTAIRPDEMSGG